METPSTSHVGSKGGSLGNFLSGMETVFVPLLRFAPADLGNFLSGMETRAPELLQFTVDVLGNFLSGMETDVCLGVDVRERLPWKLP